MNNIFTITDTDILFVNVLLNGNFMVTYPNDAIKILTVLPGEEGKNIWRFDDNMYSDEENIAEAERLGRLIENKTAYDNAES